MYIDTSETILDIFFCVEKKKTFTVFSNFKISLWLLQIITTGHIIRPYLHAALKLTA